MALTLLEFPEIDSTSARAHALLESGGARPPFAVRADRQTAGRGRRGAGWESPAGNLHLTVVLPQGGAPAELALAPLKAALITARFVARALGIQLTLKWPNDLLFAGRKLGGLLLEGSLRGQEPGAVMIGVGLNLAQAPALAAPARAVSLADITGAAPDPKAFGEGLAHALADEWARWSGAALLRAFADLAIPDGSVWQANDDARAFRRGGGLGDDGALLLAPLDGAGSALRLTSVDHKYHWIYQGTFADAQPLLVADVGNTSTKLAFLSPANAAKAGAARPFGDADDDALGAELARLADALPARGWPVHVLSVNPRRLARLAELAAGVGLAVVQVPKRNVRRRGEHYRLDELGLDRLALIEGWLGDHSCPGVTGILVSAGTATTVDLVDADGTHRGGLIMPGLQTALDSLHAATGLLPKLDLRAASPADAPGSGTRAAMANGALIAAIGAVLHVARTARNPRLILTGGFAPLLAPHLPGARVVPDLALRGAQILTLGGNLREGGG